MGNENWVYGEVWDQEGNPKRSIRDKEVTWENLSADFLSSQEDDYRRRRSFYLKSFSLKEAKSNADMSIGRKFLCQLKKLVRCGRRRPRM